MLRKRDASVEKVTFRRRRYRRESQITGVFMHLTAIYLGRKWISLCVHYFINFRGKNSFALSFRCSTNSIPFFFLQFFQLVCVWQRVWGDLVLIFKYLLQWEWMTEFFAWQKEMRVIEKKGTFFVTNDHIIIDYQKDPTNSKRKYSNWKNEIMNEEKLKW